MDAKSVTGRRYFAILIGVNDYPEKPLRGCVRDVQDIKTHLDRVLEDSIETHLLTSSTTGPGGQAPERGDGLRATFENVVSALGSVQSVAKSRDFVYVHFSGHGTRVPPVHEFSDPSTGDLALVLYSGRDGQCRCLRGYELAGALKVMIDRGVVVSLVLDCCFAATVYRHGDANDRFLPYDALLESSHGDERLASGLDAPALRDASMRRNWLINPHRYAILTACGPHEKANEPSFNSQRHGALSYYLLETLAECGLATAFGDAHARVRAKFVRARLSQSPVLYGNARQGIFGQAQPSLPIMAVSAVEKKDGTMELPAGCAHGIALGDQFRLHPLTSSTDDSPSQAQSVDAQVIRVGPLASDLRHTAEAPLRVTTGWMAKALSWRSLGKYPIRLASDLPDRDQWLRALHERSLVAHVNSDSCPFMFSVMLGNGEEYRVLDQDNKDLVYMPRMPRAEMSVDEAADIIWHLARFRMTHDLAEEMPDDSFLSTFSVYLQRDEKTFGPGRVLDVQDNASARLVVENHGHQAIYFSVLHLGPNWQVENLIKASYSAVPPRDDAEGFRGRVKKNLTMTVPKQVKQKGDYSCRDVIKVFVTSRPTCFGLLELPRLGHHARLGEFRKASRYGSGAPDRYATVHFSIRTSCPG